MVAKLCTATTTNVRNSAAESTLTFESLQDAYQKVREVMHEDIEKATHAAMNQNPKEIILSESDYQIIDERPVHALPKPRE